MKPITFDQVGNTNHMRHQLLFLNVNILHLRFIHDLLHDHGPSCIQTRDGRTLPTELWLQILKHAEEIAAQQGPAYKLVQASVVPSLTTPSGAKILRCVVHKFERRRGRQDQKSKFGIAGSLTDLGSVQGLEDVLYYATPFNVSRFNIIANRARAALPWNTSNPAVREDLDMLPLAGPNYPVTIEEVPGPGNVYFIAVHPEPTPGTKTQDPGYLSGLYCDIKAPDVIAYLEDGACWWCRGRRLICFCRSCDADGRKYTLLRRPDEFGPGSWNLYPPSHAVVCPMCVSWELAQKHHSFKRNNGWTVWNMASRRGSESYNEPKVQAEAKLYREFEERMVELGYIQDEPDTFMHMLRALPCCYYYDAHARRRTQQLSGPAPRVEV